MSSGKGDLLFLQIREESCDLMPLLLAILFWLIMQINNAVLTNRKYKSDHRLPKDKMEEALGWAQIWGEEWMFKNPRNCPEPVLKESWYRLKLHQHPDKDREWVEKTWPYKYDRPALPNKEVWEDYWTEQTGMEPYQYERKYPYLKWPNDRDEWGFKIMNQESNTYGQ